MTDEAVTAANTPAQVAEPPAAEGQSQLKQQRRGQRGSGRGRQNGNARQDGPAVQAMMMHDGFGFDDHLYATHFQQQSLSAGQQHMASIAQQQWHAAHQQSGHFPPPPQYFGGGGGNYFHDTVNMIYSGAPIVKMCVDEYDRGRGGEYVDCYAPPPYAGGANAAADTTVAEGTTDESAADAETKLNNKAAANHNPSEGKLKTTTAKSTSARADANGTPKKTPDRLFFFVTDPLSRRLRLPLSAVVEDTRAMHRSGIPSVCLLHLEGRKKCRQGASCKQVHADPAVVLPLRRAALAKVSCCLKHGEEQSIDIFSSSTFAAHSTASASDAAPVDTAIAKNTEQQPASAAKDADTTTSASLSLRFVVFIDGVEFTREELTTTEGLRSLLLQQLEDAQPQPTTPSTDDGHSDNDTCNSDDGPTKKQKQQVDELRRDDGVDTPREPRRLRLVAQAQSICRLHAASATTSEAANGSGSGAGGALSVASRSSGRRCCCFEGDCKFLHVCNEVLRANPQLLRAVVESQQEKSSKTSNAAATATAGSRPHAYVPEYDVVAGGTFHCAFGGDDTTSQCTSATAATTGDATPELTTHTSAAGGDNTKMFEVPSSSFGADAASVSSAKGGGGSEGLARHLTSAASVITLPDDDDDQEGHEGEAGGVFPAVNMQQPYPPPVLPSGVMGMMGASAPTQTQSHTHSRPPLPLPPPVSMSMRQADSSLSSSTPNMVSHTTPPRPNAPVVPQHHAGSHQQQQQPVYHQYHHQRSLHPQRNRSTDPSSAALSLSPQQLMAMSRSPRLQMQRSNHGGMPPPQLSRTPDFMPTVSVGVSGGGGVAVAPGGDVQGGNSCPCVACSSPAVGCASQTPGGGVRPQSGGGGGGSFGGMPMLPPAAHMTASAAPDTTVGGYNSFEFNSVGSSHHPPLEFDDGDSRAMPGARHDYPNDYHRTMGSSHHTHQLHSHHTQQSFSPLQMHQTGGVPFARSADPTTDSGAPRAVVSFGETPPQNHQQQQSYLNQNNHAGDGNTGGSLRIGDPAGPTGGGGGGMTFPVHASAAYERMRRYHSVDDVAAKLRQRASRALVVSPVVAQPPAAVGPSEVEREQQPRLVLIRPKKKPATVVDPDRPARPEMVSSLHQQPNLRNPLGDDFDDESSRCSNAADADDGASSTEELASTTSANGGSRSRGSTHHHQHVAIVSSTPKVTMSASSLGAGGGRFSHDPYSSMAVSAPSNPHSLGASPVGGGGAYLIRGLGESTPGEGTGELDAGDEGVSAHYEM